jgi:hypothetical protein
MHPNPNKTSLSNAICGVISRKTVNPNAVQYGISVHRHHGRLGCALSEFYCISVRNELLALGMYSRLEVVNLFVIACFSGFVTTLCRALEKINTLILNL